MTFLQFLSTQAWAVPSGLLYGGAILTALLRWNRHPQVSLVALAGCGILLMNLVIGAGVHYWLLTANERGVDPMEMARFTSMVTIIRVAFGTAGTAALLVAVFGWRRQHGMSPDGVRD